MITFNQTARNRSVLAGLHSESSEASLLDPKQRDSIQGVADLLKLHISTSLILTSRLFYRYTILPPRVLLQRKTLATSILSYAFFLSIPFPFLTTKGASFM